MVVDGEIVAAAQEERFSRRKHDASFPIGAIAYCLKQAGTKLQYIDQIVFYDKPLVKFERLLETYLAHAASAFFPSPFERAAVLCLDGVGEWATTSVWMGLGHQLTPQWEIHFPHSIITNLFIDRIYAV
ncbi:carbamoyltransferase N-terminal domain-containing protein [Anabaena sp. WA102]|uniref:carbamoyltransferase N-terminal domain-containing protein n=1 Tax=Anabaena sp. WA102 TaxID=1647413 RepID=UPI001F3B44CF|nr:carbamoyltransferase N-terminal domain-containing protein [Anabaena sp. WA102]